jgi:hypothetical protein
MKPGCEIRTNPHDRNSVVGTLKEKAAVLRFYLFLLFFISRMIRDARVVKQVH